MAIYSSIIDLAGGTPMVELRRLQEKLGLCVRLLAKLEGFNPAGSAKDRAALEMLRDARERGVLTKDSVIVEPTSGNTGIALAWAAAVQGYRCTIVMPENMSEERQKLIRAYGAELVLTPAEEGMAGSIRVAQQLLQTIPNAFLADQFGNPANAAAHLKTTGPEIWEDTEGQVDLLVCGVGTGGTISGTGNYLKSRKPDIRVIAAEPASSPVLSGGKAGPHGLQGLGAGFVPDALDTSVYDEVICVTEAEAYAAARELTVTEGILAGISCGAALHAACAAGRREENRGKTVVVLLPDSGERYLSTDLFR